MRILSTFFLGLMLVFAACDSASDSDDPQAVDPGNANAVSDLLTFAGATRTEGTPPAPSSEEEAPDVSAGADAVAIQPGGQLSLNFSYADGADLAGYYLAVDGADDYFDIPFGGVSSSGGQAGLSFQLPGALGTGSFNVGYCVYNGNGQVSNIITTTITLDGNAPEEVNAGGAGSPIDGGQIPWNETAVPLRGNNGSQYSFDCPAGGTLSSAWGTDLYTDDSSICTAAVHAGEITQARGGTVTIEIRPGASSYNGTARNGVTSSNWGQWSGSFVFP